MAIRKQTGSPFSGGISRWITADEARELGTEFVRRSVSPAVATKT
jgi:hypothetical protein